MTAGERPFRYLSGRGSTNSIRSDTRLQKCTYGASPSGWPSSSVRGELEGHGVFPTHMQHAQVGLPSQLYHKAPSGEGAGGNQWLWRGGETGGLESSGTRVVGKTSHTASKERGISRLLQPAVSGPKARRSVAAGHRSKRAERVFGDRIVPDGDSGDDKVSATNRRMGNIGRPIGCVPPHSPSRSFQEILPIYGGKTNVPVCGHAIRTSLGTTDLYSFRERHKDDPRKTSDSGTHLSRRLLNQGKVRSGGLRKDSTLVRGFDQSRPGGKCSEIRTDPFADFQVCGIWLQPPGGGGVPLPRSGGRNPCKSNCIGTTAIHNSSQAVILPRSASSHGKDGGKGQITHAASSANAEGTLVSSTTFKHQGSHQSKRNFELVGKPRKLASKSTATQTNPGGHSVHGRLHERLGSSSPSGHNTGSLVKARGDLAHKCVGTESGVVSSREVSPSGGRKGGANMHRQLHGAIPRKQAGRHQVSPDVGIDLGVITVVPRAGDYPTGTTHSGRKECYRRCSVENTPDPSNGVGITPPDLPSPVQGVGDAGSGFVRYGVQQTPSPVCFTPTRYSGSGSGRQCRGRGCSLMRSPLSRC